MSSRLWRGAGALTVAAVLALSGTADAQQRENQRRKPRQVPDTGVETPVPTPADADGEAALERMLDRSSEGLVEVAQPGGAVSIDLQGRFMSVLLTGIDASGKPVTSCLTSLDALKPQDHKHSTTITATATPQRDSTSTPKRTVVREDK